MTSTQTKALFNYEERIFEILCTGKETINEIIQKFMIIIFIMKGELLSQKLMKDLLKIMNILVKKNLL